MDWMQFHPFEKIMDFHKRFVLIYNTRKARRTNVAFERAFTLVTPSSFFDARLNFFDGIKEWTGPFCDAHQLGIRLNLMLTSKS